MSSVIGLGTSGAFLEKVEGMDEASECEDRSGIYNSGEGSYWMEKWL